MILSILNLECFITFLSSQFFSTASFLGDESRKEQVILLELEAGEFVSPPCMILES